MCTRYDEECIHRKILCVEIILSARARTHTHAHTGRVRQGHKDTGPNIGPGLICTKTRTHGKRIECFPSESMHYYIVVLPEPKTEWPHA